MELTKFDGFAVALVFMALATSGCLNDTQDYDLSELPIASVSGYALNANGSAIVSVWDEASHASLWRVDAHGGDVELFLQLPGEDLTSPALSEDGGFLAFVSTRFGDGTREERAHDLRIMDLQSQETSAVLTRHDWIYDVALSADGSVAYIVTTDEPAPYPWETGHSAAYDMQVDVATGSASKVSAAFTGIRDLHVAHGRVLTVIYEPCQMDLRCDVRYGIHELRNGSMHKLAIPGVDVSDASSPDRSARHFCNASSGRGISVHVDRLKMYELELDGLEYKEVATLPRQLRSACMVQDGTVWGIDPWERFEDGARLVAWNPTTENLRVLLDPTA